MGETETVQVFFRGRIGERVHKNFLLSPPCQVGDGEKVHLVLPDRPGQFLERSSFSTDDPIHLVKDFMISSWKKLAVNPPPRDIRLGDRPP
jgi:hypothetical protein